MKDQVIMSKTNGQLAVAVPLYRRHYDEELGRLEGYSISLTNDDPLAYVVECHESCALMNREAVEKNCEFLSDL